MSIERAVADHLSPYVPLWREILIDTMRFLADRYEARQAEHVINTKVNIITGEDFAQRGSALTIYSDQVIYGWIQGRSLEAIADHIAWLPRVLQEGDTLRHRLRRMLAEVVEHLEDLRRRNRGRLWFMFDPNGAPLRITSDGRIVPLGTNERRTTYTDLFYFKGLFAAATCLGRNKLTDEAEEAYRKATDAVLRDDFVNAQQPMDPNNPVAPVPGRCSHGSRMIALDGIARMLKHTADPAWRAKGTALIRYVLNRHVNCGQFPGLPDGAFIEFITPEGDPWLQNGAIICDPGHALEFVGLTCKVLRELRRIDPDAYRPLFEECRRRLPVVFRGSYEEGFQAAEGICKTFDWLTRKPVNADMPWWPLPETIRSAALLIDLYPDIDRSFYLQAIDACHRAFVTHYTQRDFYHLAIQTCDARGHPVDVIPAVPDVDPGYHTGLSFLDLLSECAEPG